MQPPLRYTTEFSSGGVLGPDACNRLPRALALGADPTASVGQSRIHSSDGLGNYPKTWVIRRGFPVDDPTDAATIRYHHIRQPER